MKSYTSIFIIFILLIPGNAIPQQRNNTASYKQNTSLRLNTNPSIIQNDTAICDGSSISLSLNLSESIVAAILPPGSPFKYSFITPSFFHNQLLSST